jgi:hypothetical protein
MKKLKLVMWYLVALLMGCESKERTTMLTNQKMETYCIGRLLFDVPAEFHPTLPLSAIFRAKDPNKKAASISVTVLADSVATPIFAAAVAKRRNEIIASMREKRNVLTETITRGADLTLFRVSRIEDSYMSEIHLLRNNIYLTAEARSHSGLFNEAERDLLAFADDIHPANMITAPQSGFCLGLVAVQGTHEAESTTVMFRSDKRPDIVISIGIDTYGRDDPVSLFQRVSGPNSLLEKVDVRSKQLRKGQLNVLGMNAQEWLGSVKLGEDRDEKQFGFALETRRANPGPASPRIHVELDSGIQDQNGVEHSNSLSDAQAMALWDSIIRSIRQRPSALDAK